NPLVWVAAVLSRRDADLFADDGAIKALGEDEREDYGKTLVDLTVAASRAPILNGATMMAGGKRAIFERVKRIAKRPKVSVAAILAVVILTSAALVFAFTGKASEKMPENGTETEKIDETESPTDPDSLLFDEQPFENIMGFSGVSVRTYPDSAWHERIYLAESDGKYLPIAISFRFGESDDHIADIDGDGVTELICNCIHGADGAARAYVFKAKDGSIVKYDINPSRVKGWGLINTYEYSTKYDPERFAIILSGSEDKVTGESKSITISFPSSTFYEHDSYLYLTDKSVIEEIDRKYGVNLDLDSALDRLYNSIGDKNKDKDTETGAEDTTTDPIDTEKETDQIDTEKETAPVETEIERTEDTAPVTVVDVEPDYESYVLPRINWNTVSIIREAYKAKHPLVNDENIDYILYPLCYYGKFGEAYVFRFSGVATDNMWGETIAGVGFQYTNGNMIQVLYNNDFYRLQEAYDSNILTVEQLKIIAYLHSKKRYNSWQPVYMPTVNWIDDSESEDTTQAEDTAPQIFGSYKLTVLGNEVPLDREYGFLETKINDHSSDTVTVAEMPLFTVIRALGYEIEKGYDEDEDYYYYRFSIEGTTFGVDTKYCTLGFKRRRDLIRDTGFGISPHFEGDEYVVDSEKLSSLLHSFPGCRIIVDADNGTVDIVKID
ncbi:MAG: hypothetical protein IJT91_04685, partial [Clostridia bacterium]|nr:hypothetical protein [Clostridia bacterium]